MYREYKVLSKLILFDVTETKEPKGMENVMRTVWTPIFPSFETLTIQFSKNYRFRLEGLLEAIQSISSLNTVIITVYHEWVKDVLTDEISAEFDAAGWSIEYDNRRCTLH